MFPPSVRDPASMTKAEGKLYVAGAHGMVGSAVMRALEARGTADILAPDRTALDLTDQHAVNAYFERERPRAVVLAAAKVGGILANDRYRADFLYENLMIEANVMRAAFDNGVEKLIFLGSSCVYPREAPQPIKESSLLTGPLEPTNEPYAVAKIAGIKLCENLYRQHGANFYSLMPTNLYGPNDNFDLETSHVIPALIRKIHAAKSDAAASVEAWGTGKPRREFMYVDDLADAVVFYLENVDASSIYGRGVSHVNIGFGEDITIRELIENISSIIGFGGQVEFDSTKPDGTPRKLLDVSLSNELGWSAKTSLADGLVETYNWYLENEQ